MIPLPSRRTLGAILIGLGLFTLLAMLAVQTVRINGFQVTLPFIGAVGPVGLKADNEALRTRITKLEAEKAAAALVKAQTEAANTLATEKANRDDKRYAKSDRADADRYIAANRLRPDTANPARAPSDQSPGVNAGAGGMPVMDELRTELVTVTADDIRICTVNTRNALLWQEWGLSIEANHGGE